MLWIAFKFVILQGIKHLLLTQYLTSEGCELLSNLYFCRVSNTIGFRFMKELRVVNCFQICTFAGYQTPSKVPPFSRSMLWIAFKFVLLQGIKHLSVIHRERCTGCELLSNLYFCRVSNTRQSAETSTTQVVNCFQICTFAGYQTPQWL